MKREIPTRWAVYTHNYLGLKIVLLGPYKTEQDAIDRRKEFGYDFDTKENFIDVYDGK